MKTKSIFRSALCAALLLSAGAHAYISCSGTLSGVLMYANGNVMIQGTWRNDWTTICNTQTDWGGIDTSACVAWYGAAVKTSQSHITVGIYYNGDAYTCANLPTYGSTPPPVDFLTYVS